MGSGYFLGSEIFHKKFYGGVRDFAQKFWGGFRYLYKSGKTAAKEAYNTIISSFFILGGSEIRHKSSGVGKIMGPGVNVSEIVCIVVK